MKEISVALLTEDTYTPAFIDKIIRRLMESKIITDRKINICKGKNTYRKIQLCTDKIRRLIKNIIDV
ncbi:hypothetical protein HS5_05340 [Acidianus sp. HS-5]|nr:hypothetical protein HS5_05340 [Acidianus sp. HS-5]